jgi:hypothetical protein
MSLDVFLSESGGDERVEASPPRLYMKAGFLTNFLRLYKAVGIQFFGLFPMNGRAGSAIEDENAYRAIDLLIDRVFNLPYTQTPFGVLNVKDALKALKGLPALENVVYDFSERCGVIKRGQLTVYRYEGEREIRGADYLRRLQPVATAYVSARDLLQILKLFRGVWQFSISCSEGGLVFKSEEGLEKSLRGRVSGKVENHVFNVGLLSDFVNGVERLGIRSLAVSFHIERGWPAPMRVRGRVADMVLDYYLAPIRA